MCQSGAGPAPLRKGLFRLEGFPLGICDVICMYNAEVNVYEEAVHDLVKQSESEQTGKVTSDQIEPKHVRHRASRELKSLRCYEDLLKSCAVVPLIL